jgi:hypothetical protein
MNQTTSELLAERHKTHGSFNDHARITIKLKAVYREELRKRIDRNQPMLNDTQLESMDMILHKIGRIIAGDASFQDHWDDIAGYAKIANGVDK